MEMVPLIKKMVDIDTREDTSTLQGVPAEDAGEAGNT